MSTRQRFSKEKYDAVVVGSGPNGLAAAIVLAQKGMSVCVVEGQSTIGGGCRSAELTLPGFVHDVCSSIHPLGIGSPFFRTLPLEKHGLQWVQPQASYAHPFDHGKAVVVERSIEETAVQFGDDAGSYIKLMKHFVPRDWDRLCEILREPAQLARYPLALANFGIHAMQSTRTYASANFKGELARATFAGTAAHSSLPLDALASASFGIVLALTAHAVGWPTPRGGAQQLTDALVSYLVSLGAEVMPLTPVQSLDDLPQWRYLMLDLTPAQILKIAGRHLRPGYRHGLQRYKYGPASFKMDWALDGPIPWAAGQVARAGTVHIGGTLEEIAAAEAGNWHGETAQRPYVLLVQTSLFDPTRAPAGKHTAWAYCHVPNGCTQDMSERIECQIERFAPGFKKLILARSVMSPAKIEEHNANYVGGDINGGAPNFSQLFTRPILRPIPFSTPIEGMYICSSATPPGGGVHGMCGYYAAQCALHGWQ